MTIKKMTMNPESDWRIRIISSGVVSDLTRWKCLVACHHRIYKKMSESDKSVV